jgi:transposase InsO family protein
MSREPSLRSHKSWPESADDYLRQAEHARLFVERLWRSLKHESVYLYAYEDVAAARAGIGRYLRFYNEARPHQSLGYQTPASFYDGSPCGRRAA